MYTASNDIDSNILCVYNLKFYNIMPLSNDEDFFKTLFNWKRMLLTVNLSNKK